MLICIHYILNPLLINLIVFTGGSSFPSGMGMYDPDSGINEKIAVISGCVGGLLLVIVLLATYCYCFPSALKSRLNTRRRNQNNVADIEDKGENSENVINGGSIVVKSASRGSILVNTGQEAACALQNDTCGAAMANSVESNNKNCTPEKRRLESAEYKEVQNSPQNRLSKDLSGVEARQNEDNEMELNSRKSLSMSIPDVTKVDPRRDSFIENPPPQNTLPPVPQPQFFTLGRRQLARNAPRNSYFDPRAFEIASERADLQQHQRHSFHPGLHHQQFVLPHRQSQHEVDLQGGLPTAGSYYNIFRPQQAASSSAVASVTPPPPQKPQRRQESESSLYQEGSVDGDSITDGLLCDDRTASPPPPAPSGPEPQNPIMAYSSLKRRSLALL